MSSAISQLSSFSSMVSSRRLQLHTRRYNLSSKKVLHVLNSDEHGTKASHLDNKPGPSYVEDASTSHNGSSVKSHTVAEGFGLGGETNGHGENKVVNQPERTAKIHDFCLGIPFGGLVLIGALFSFILSRNTVTLSGGVLYGGALLALSTSSLKVWRKGKSTLPFILGQAGLVAHCQSSPLSELQHSPLPSCGRIFRHMH